MSAISNFILGLEGGVPFGDVDGVANFLEGVEPFLEGVDVHI